MLPSSWTALRRLGRLLAIAAVAPLLAGAGCGGMPTMGSSSTGVTVRMDFTRKASLYDAPFPSDDLLGATGGSGGPAGGPLSRIPNASQATVIQQAIALIGPAPTSFSVTAPIYLPLTGAVDPASLPDLAGSLKDDASAFLFDLATGTRVPAKIGFLDDGGPYGAPDLLAFLPYQGIPLEPGTRYAAVATTAITDTTGAPLSQADAVGGFLDAGAGSASAEYTDAIAKLANAGVDTRRIAGLAVFTTGSPIDELAQYTKAALAQPTRTVALPFHADEVFDRYCVFSSTTALWDFQTGTPPYSHEGGAWQLDSPHLETAGVVVTIPRTPMPPGGYPTVVFIQTGAGGVRPLVDRGVQATPGGPPIAPGSGPAQEFAAVGWAAIQVDLALENLRNPSGGSTNEDFQIFNVFNPAALRDNIRESAIELAQIAHLVPTIAVAIDTTKCTGAPSVATLDGTKLSLFGHSMGASIAPLALAAEPLYRAAILSGAGGSYIENVMWKKQPLTVRPLVEALLDYPMDDRTLVENDPGLGLIQWAAEPSDSQVYGAYVAKRAGPPTHVLSLQGIVDHYIEPAIANAVSLTLGLDLGGTPLDDPAVHPEYVGQGRILDLLPYVGRKAAPYPIAGNVTVGGSPRTGALVQHMGDAIEDGHEANFQTEPPKHQYRCYLKSFAESGVPSVPADDAADAPCP